MIKMNIKIKAIYHKCLINLPILVLISVMAFIYTVYAITFLTPLLTNNYVHGYSINSLWQNDSKLMVSMKLVSKSTNIIVQAIHNLNLNSNSEISYNQTKGWIYFSILHFFIFFLCIAFFRTIYVDPGRVTNNWNLKQEEVIKSFRRDASTKAIFKVLDAEKRIHMNIQKNLENMKLQMRHSSSYNELAFRRGSQNLYFDSLGEIQRERDDVCHIRVSKSMNKDVIGNIEIENYLLSEEEHKLIKLKSSSLTDLQRITIDLEETGSLIFDRDLASAVDDPRINKFILDEYVSLIKQYEFEILEELKKEHRIRYCQHCQHYKPERTHHCRSCDACTLKMDHHCTVLANCIGFYNHKFFMILLIYSILTLWLIWITSAELVGDSILNSTIGNIELFLIVMMYILTLSLACILSLFFGFHIWLINRGITTLEYIDKKEKYSYELTSTERFKSVFGKSFLVWFIPFFPNYDGDGLDYFPIPNKLKRKRRVNK